MSGYILSQINIPLLCVLDLKIQKSYSIYVATLLWLLWYVQEEEDDDEFEDQENRDPAEVPLLKTVPKSQNLKRASEKMGKRVKGQDRGKLGPMSFILQLNKPHILSVSSKMPSDTEFADKYLYGAL